MLSKGGSDLVVVTGDGAPDQLKLAADQRNAKGAGFQKGWLIAQREGAHDRGESFLDQLLTSRALQIVELADGRGTGIFERLKSRPFEQQRGGQRSPKVLAAQLEGLRKVLLENGLQAVGQFGALIHHRPPVGDEVLQTPGVGVLGRPGDAKKVKAMTFGFARRCACGK